MIEISNLVKKYGDHMAVDHLSLTVEPGKIYGLWDQMAPESQPP